MKIKYSLIQFWQLPKEISVRGSSKCEKHVTLTLWWNKWWHSCHPARQAQGFEAENCFQCVWPEMIAQHIVMAFYPTSGECWYVLCYHFHILWRLCILFHKLKINLWIKDGKLFHYICLVFFFSFLFWCSFIYTAICFIFKQVGRQE